MLVRGAVRQALSNRFGGDQCLQFYLRENKVRALAKFTGPPGHTIASLSGIQRLRYENESEIPYVGRVRLQRRPGRAVLLC